MSTKTTLKRVAFVAVSALTFGLLSAVPSSAADLTFTKSGAVLGTGTAADPFIFTVGSSGTLTSAPVLTAASVTPALPAGFGTVAVGVNGVITGIPTGPVASAAYTISQPAPNAKSETIYMAVQTVASSNIWPWRAITPAGSFNPATGAVSVSKTVTSVEDYVVLAAEFDTGSKSGTGNYRYLEVTGSSIFATTTPLGTGITNGQLNGSQASGTGTTFVPGTATVLALPQDGLISGDQVWVATPTAGSITVRFWDRTYDSVTQFVTTTLLQTITITASAPAGLSTTLSTSYIDAGQAANSTTGIAVNTCTPVGLEPGCDKSVLAPMAVQGLSAIGTAKAVISVNLRGTDGASYIGALPSARVVVKGPGTVSLSNTANAAASEGRDISRTALTSPDFFINVFSDGTSGTSTIDIYIGGTLWTSETMNFYGAASQLKVTSYLEVLPANGGSLGLCAANWTSCTAGTVALTPAVKVQALDAADVPVPYRTYTVTSSDATVLSATTVSSAQETTGSRWFSATSPVTATSGKTATHTFTSGTLTATKSYKIGGAPNKATLSVVAGKSVGELGTMTINVTDAQNNPAYDNDHQIALASNVALTTALGQINTLNNFMLINGKSEIDFYNPLVGSTVVLTGLIDAVLPITGTFTVGNPDIQAVLDAAQAAIAAAKAAQDASVAEAAKATAAAKAAQDAAVAQAKAAEDMASAAADAAAEAIDAANAATDAANLAAEAADAATVAAEEARDAADAATAAIEELATQVASLIASLKAQITTLANTVAKIAKKVKA
ncbi:MAG: hypothetical protein ACO3E4_06915 [Candidatus Nanopelagicaceae bacterium]